MRLKTDNRFHKLEVAMRQVQADIKKMAGKETQDRIEALEEFATYADNLLTQLNHALPDTQEPKPKQLDQSVFNHEYVTDAFNYVAINADGQSIFFSDRPNSNKELGIWFTTSGSTMLMLKGYDTTDWQNSLIERDKVELTGSDLCRAMLERGDKWVLCFVANNIANIFLSTRPVVVHAFSDGRFVSVSGCYDFAVAVNNQGEPLTQSEVGL